MSVPAEPVPAGEVYVDASLDRPTCWYFFLPGQRVGFEYDRRAVHWTFRDQYVAEYRAQGYRVVGDTGES